MKPVKSVKEEKGKIGKNDSLDKSERELIANVINVEKSCEESNHKKSKREE